VVINQGDEISVKNMQGSYILSKIEGDKGFVRKIKNNGDLQKKRN
jgi:hypothetical protein